MRTLNYRSKCCHFPYDSKIITFPSSSPVSNSITLFSSPLNLLPTPLLYFQAHYFAFNSITLFPSPLLCFQNNYSLFNSSLQLHYCVPILLIFSIIFPNPFIYSNISTNFLTPSLCSQLNYTTQPCWSISNSIVAFPTYLLSSQLNSLLWIRLYIFKLR